VSQTPNLSIVIPCYNEEQRILRFESEWKKFLVGHGTNLFQKFPRVEIIFINDGSKDRTDSLIREACGRLSTDIVSVSFASLSRNQGKGAAVRRGFEMARGDFVLMTDVDLSCPLSELFKLVDAHVDLALGSRALKDSLVLKAQGGGRPSLGRLFNSFLRLMTGIPFKDTQCGFKLIEGSLARRLASELRENRFAFDVELLLLANQAKASMKEVPVRWEHQEPSRVVVWRDGLQMSMRVISLAIEYGRWRT
jgi:glycosyltransferase involved in cell wall biosynthesis